jgi:hypothetical protein
MTRIHNGRRLGGGLKQGGAEMTENSGRLRAAIVGLAAMFTLDESRAGQIPESLFGKSIVLGWSDVRTIKNTQSGRLFIQGQQSSVSLYISEKGRTFSSLRRELYVQGHRSMDAATNNEVSGTEKVLHWRFEGDSLVADQAFLRGARRVSISFDNGYHNCSIAVLHGKVSADAPIQLTGLMAA